MFKIKERWGYLIYLIWFSYLFFSATIMFCRGFMLVKESLNDVTQCVSLDKIDCYGFEVNNTDAEIRKDCSDDVKLSKILSNLHSPFVCPSRGNRVLLLIVDALRYDFTQYDPDLEHPLAYQNKVPFISELIAQDPTKAKLSKFLADPPTTTMQRLKALVTGSLPTFIEAGSNFAATELNEDNIIDQLVRSGGKAVLLGDDTWARLLPNRWLRTHAQYSFHTWDLDTVDNEVDSRIFEELAARDWELLVAHYLGVDHAGHRHGPAHREMARKLRELDDRLRRVVAALPADVTLYVVGDHGMTETGDHGGASEAERTAAWLAYRGAGLHAGWAPVARQTDLAPTVAAVLARAPPASALGATQPWALPPTPRHHLLLHLRNNLKQVAEYFHKYSMTSTQLAPEKVSLVVKGYEALHKKMTSVTNDEELKLFAEEVGSFLEEARAICHDAWVEFDSVSMMRGLLLLFMTIFINYLVSEGIPLDRIPFIFSSSFIPFSLVSLLGSAALVYFGRKLDILVDMEHSLFLTTGLVSTFIVSVLVMLHWDGITQRWVERKSSWYERISRSMFVATCGAVFSNSFIIEEASVLVFLFLTGLVFFALHVGTLRGALLWAGVATCLALSRNYRSCREEQNECWLNQTNEASKLSLVMAIVCCVLFGYGLRRCGVLGQWVGYGFAAIEVCISGHWAAGWGHLRSGKRSRLMARMAWIGLGLQLLFLLRRDGKGPVSHLTALSVVLCLANFLVLGVNYAPAAVLMLLAAALTLELFACLRSDGYKGGGSRTDWSLACLWAVLANCALTHTGHHATFSHIRWAAAFHAGDAPPPLAAALVLLNTAGMALLLGGCVPLLALWGRGARPASPRAQLTAVFALTHKFCLCFALRLASCALAATIHCRHLMVWSVFAPKLLFECVAGGAAVLGALLGYGTLLLQLPERAT